MGVMVRGVVDLEHGNWRSGQADVSGRRVAIAAVDVRYSGVNEDTKGTRVCKERGIVAKEASQAKEKQAMLLECFSSRRALGREIVGFRRRMKPRVVGGAKGDVVESPGRSRGCRLSNSEVGDSLTLPTGVVVPLSSWSVSSMEEGGNRRRTTCHLSPPGSSSQTHGSPMLIVGPAALLALARRLAAFGIACYHGQPRCTGHLTYPCLWRVSRVSSTVLVDCVCFFHLHMYSFSDGTCSLWLRDKLTIPKSPNKTSSAALFRNARATAGETHVSPPICRSVHAAQCTVPFKIHRSACACIQFGSSSSLPDTCLLSAKLGTNSGVGRLAMLQIT